MRRRRILRAFQLNRDSALTNHRLHLSLKRSRARAEEIWLRDLLAEGSLISQLLLDPPVRDGGLEEFLAGDGVAVAEVEGDGGGAGVGDEAGVAVAAGEVLGEGDKHAAEAAALEARADGDLAHFHRLGVEGLEEKDRGDAGAGSRNFTTAFVALVSRAVFAEKGEMVAEELSRALGIGPGEAERLAEDFLAEAKGLSVFRAAEGEDAGGHGRFFMPESGGDGEWDLRGGPAKLSGGRS